jgi:hypothetical protein
MSIRTLILLLCIGVAFSSCEKNMVSKIPYINLLAFEPDSMRVNIDTTYFEFDITDGDADIGNDTVSVIHLRDSRFDTAGFVKTPFPPIDGSIQDPKKGMEGYCVFFPFPQPVPRGDSIHTHFGDTLTYELYITDRAGNESNHITTHPLIIRP